MPPKLMLPFLAEVQLVNVAGNTHGAADTTIKPDVNAQVDHALQVVRVIADEAIDVARVAADTALKNADASAAKIKDEARAKADAKVKNDDDDDDHPDVTINNGTKSIVVHHSKSHDDVPFAVVPIVAITFTFLWLIVRALMAPFTRRNRGSGQAPVVMEGLSAEEAAILEKLQRTLAQMESRVESLETILIDTARTKEKYGTKL